MSDNLGNLQMLPAELDRPRRDGRQYEVVDGRLLVTGAQPPIHHAAVVGLLVRLKGACPPDQLITAGSLDFRPRHGLTLRPDLLVCRRADAGPKFLDRPPLLVIEVLSPSTRITDVVLKRGLYEQADIPSYWFLDPDRQELTVLDLSDGRYICQAVVQGEETFHATLPFPTRIVPAQLVG